MARSYNYAVLCSRLVVSYCLCLFLVSCGGGGGGDGSSGSNGKSAATGIRIIHAAFDFPALQIKAGDGKVLSSATFGKIAYHGAVSSGLNSFLVTSSSNPLTGLWSASAEFAKNQRKSILAFAGYKEKDIRFTLLEDAGIEVPSGSAAVRVVNAIVDSGSASVAIPGVLSSSAAVLGSASKYELIPSGTYDFLISSGSTTLGRVSGTIQSGQAYSVTGSGAAGYLVTTSLLQD